MAKTRVLLVGAGRRVQRTIIPALHCMRPWVDLVGVHTRTARDIALLGGRFTARTRDSFSEVDPSSIDAIIVAVNIRHVPGVLRSLDPFATDGITLMLDTPVLDPRDLGATRYFPHYRQVLASEEHYALPTFVLARRLIEERRIGRLRHVFFFHSGYRHHALASLRQITGTQPTRISVRRWSKTSARLSGRLPGGSSVTIVEPRKYGAGRTMIVGDRGFIVDYRISHPRASLIGYRREAGRYAGLTLDGEPIPPTELDTALLDGVRDAELADPSLYGLLKVRAFMSLLSGLADETSEWRYPAYDGIWDNLSLRAAERLGFVKDFRLGRSSTALRGAIRAAAGVSRITSGR